jgi:hypothetical protein
LARDIVNEEVISVTISEDINTFDNNTISDIDTIHYMHKLKKKYYKYKGKYLEMRMSSVNEN